MAFRYEIWRWDGVGDKYFITSYNYESDATPVDSGFSLSTQKEDGRVFYRVTSSGNLLFKGGDYELISSSIQSCDTLAILIFDDCSTQRSDFLRNNFWNKADYIGIIKKTNVVIDYDRCTVSVAVETLDIYTKILRELDNKFNFIAGDKVNAEFKLTEFKIEEYEETYIQGDFPDSPFGGNNYFYPFNDPNPDLRYMIGKFGEIKYEEWDEYVAWRVTKIYFRLVRFENTDDPIDGWGYLGINTGDGLHKFAKFIIPIPPRPTYFYKKETDPIHRETWEINIIANNILDDLNTAYVLKDKINKSLDNIGYSGGFWGSFITNSINPITSEPNNITNILVAQQSDIKGRSDNAKFYDITLGELLNYYKLFDAHWFCTLTSLDRIAVRVEHKKYFENGGSYVSTAILPDFTDDNKNKTVLFVSDDNAEKSTKLNLGTIGSEDFKILDVYYEDGCVSDKVDTIDLSPMTTDFDYIRKNPDDTPDDGVVIITSKKEGISYLIIGEYIGESLLFNAKFAPTKIQEDYWGYSSPTATATLRDTDESGSIIIDDFPIKKTKKIKKRVGFIMNGIPYKKIDPRRMLTTSFGTAQFESALYSPRTKKWTATLLYE